MISVFGIKFKPTKKIKKNICIILAFARRDIYWLAKITALKVNCGGFS
jgi:hypothetical protein